MTNEERSRCEDIIDTCSAAAVAGEFCNPIKIPFIGDMSVDSAVVIGMAIKLAAVFGKSVSEGNVEGAALAALKEAAWNNSGKSAFKSLIGWLPGSQILTSGMTVAIIQEAGWTLAEQFSNSRK